MGQAKSDLTEAPRGEQVLSALKPGEHLCALCATATERRSVVESFVRAGLANRQACLYIVGNSKVELAAREFTTAGLDPRMESTGAAITVMGTRQLTHAPSVWESIEAISRWATREFSRGCETVRIALDMTFADELNFTAADLCDFEGQLKSRLIAASPIVGMCLYERSQATPEFLCQALRAHPTVLLNGHVFQSPFYESDSPAGEANSAGPGAAWIISQLEQTSRNDELVRARDRAIEGARRMAAAIANISHDLRTPLNVILGYVDIIVRKLCAQPDRVAAPELEAITRIGKRLNSNLQTMLDNSRIESGAFTLKPVEIELDSFLERQALDYRPLAQQKGLRLELGLDEKGVGLIFDEYCLAQALGNLLDNAIKFTDTGGIFMRLSRGGDGVLSLEVKDTGIGMDAGFLPLLFEPFSQENPCRTPLRGAGLGVTLAQRYLELNGAKLAVTSTKDGGTAFVIRFLRESEVAKKASASAAASEVPIDPCATDRRAVLVVDDDPDTQAFMTTLLGKHYAVLTAAGGAEVRRILESRGGVDLILTDLSLGAGEDGTELTRRIRADSRWRGIPIIALTAHATTADRQRALIAGCDDYLSKPVDRRTLFPLIDSLAARRPA